MGAIEVGVGPAGVPFLERAGDGTAFVDFAQRAESLGYASICVGDHLDGRGGPFTSLAVAACATNRLRLAVHVLCAELRNPAVVVQEVRSLQIISSGRVELGLGAGWMQRDFDEAGIARAPFGERLGRLEALAYAVRAAFDGGPVPAPRLVIGGGGPRMLAAAARLADIVTINIPLLGASGVAANTVASGTRALVEERLDIVRERAGARDIGLHLYVHEVHVGADWRDFAQRRAQALGMSFGDYTESPHVLVGDVGQLVATVEQRRDELGLAYFSIPGRAMDDFAPVLRSLKGNSE
jgi:probable F420-dependent oxidoreductase